MDKVFEEIGYFLYSKVPTIKLKTQFIASALQTSESKKRIIKFNFHPSNMVTIPGVRI